MSVSLILYRIVPSSNLNNSSYDLSRWDKSLKSYLNSYNGSIPNSYAI